MRRDGDSAWKSDPVVPSMPRWVLWGTGRNRRVSEETPPHGRIAIRAEALDSLGIERRIGTSSPGTTPAGTTALIW